MVLRKYKNTWELFHPNKQTSDLRTKDILPYGNIYGRRPTEAQLTNGIDRSKLASMYNRIALDVASYPIRHVILNSEGKFMKVKNSSLNECFTVEANIDQTGADMFYDLVITMLCEGTAVIIPTETEINPNSNRMPLNYYSFRIGRVVGWHPDSVICELVNEFTGLNEQVTMLKKRVAIIDNPFKNVVNEQESIMKRLVSKMNDLDILDNKTIHGSGDVFVQGNYSTAHPNLKARADARKKEIDRQMNSGEYGTVFLDMNERVTQLNRPMESNLLKEIERLEEEMYNQMGIPMSIITGEATEEQRNAYFNNILDIILTSIVQECSRKFLTKTARTQGHSFMYFRNPFKHATLETLTSATETLTRNAIVKPNEVRSEYGFAPSDDPSANELSNKNLKEQDRGTINNNKKEVIDEEEAS